MDPVDFGGAIPQSLTAYEPSFFTQQTFPRRTPRGGETNRPLAAIDGDPKLLPVRARRR